MTATSSPTSFPRHTVTAVLVAHDGIRWVHRSLDGLTGQTRAPDRVVAVDTGSADGTHDSLVAVLGQGRVLSAPPDTGFGAAVALGLESAAASTPAPADGERVRWVWLLHDDCEAEPEALEQLLEVVDRSPSIGVAGPKVLGWYDRRRLIEIGLTVGRSGRRETGLERHEHDQGQHDGVRDVLAVGSAGMLVRRDLWDTLGGFDRWLPLLRDDLDLGWRANLAGERVVCVTDAVVHHAEAGAHGRRRLAATVNRPHLVDRSHALYVVLANLPLLGLPLALVRALLGSLVRALGLLLGKQPGEAADELLAIVAVLTRPDRLLRARLARRSTRRVPARAVSLLLAPTGLHLRHGLEAMGTMLSRGDTAPARGAHTAATETGPASDDVESLTVGSGLARRVVTAPVTLLVTGTLVLAFAAERGLFGRGALAGGVLLPAAGRASNLWTAYLSGWHPVGLGTDTTAPPYLAVLAGVAAVLAGSVGAAATVLVLGAVPLAALSAYLATRHLVESRVLRAWAAVTYATLPVATGAVADGRIGTLLGVVLLPPLVAAGAQVVDWPDQPGSWRATGIAAVLLALVTAGAPMAWPAALALAVLGVLLLAAAAPGTLQVATGLRLLTVLAVPGFLLAPWAGQVLADPARLWREPGLPGGQFSDPDVHPWQVALLHPGGAGMYPVLVSLPLVLAALVALLRRTRRAPVMGAWLLALVGLGVGLLAQHAVVPSADGGEGPAWPGFGTLLLGAGLVVAALVGAQGAPTRIRSSSFGLRQPAAVALAALAVLVPVVAGVWWAVAGAAGPLHRERSEVLPPFVVAEAAQPDRPRTLVLRASRRGALSVSLVGEHGARIGDGDAAPDGALDGGLLGAVGALLAGSDDAVDRLAPYAVRYVVLAPPVDPRVATRFDGQPGMSRVSAEAGTFLWKSDRSIARVRALGAGQTDRPAIVAAGPVEAHGSLPRSAPAGTLELADRADDGWHATLDGTALSHRTVGGLQRFVLPGGGGRVSVTHDPSAPAWVRWAQLAVLAMSVLLALPGGRRDDDGDLPPEDEVQPEPSRGRRRRSAEELAS